MKGASQRRSMIQLPSLFRCSQPKNSGAKNFVGIIDIEIRTKALNFRYAQKINNKFLKCTTARLFTMRLKEEYSISATID